MKLLTKIFFAVLVTVMAVTVIVMAAVYSWQANQAETYYLREVRLAGDFLTSELTAGARSGQWPFESLERLKEREDLLFWWLINDSGTISLADRTDFMGTRAVDYFPGLDVAPAGEQIRLETGQAFGLYVAPVTVGAETWQVVMGFSLKELQGFRYTIMAADVIVLLSVLGALALLLFLILRQLTAPIVALTSGVRRFGGGDFSTRVSVPGSDEIGTLSESFNDMAERLAAVHDHLEREVEKKAADLAASERRYRAYVENQRDIIFSLGKDGRFDYVSPQAGRHGLDASAMIGQPMAAVVAEADRQALTKAVDEVLSGVRPSAELEVQWSAADSDKWFEVVVSAIHDADGTVRGLAGIAHDISDRKKAAEELQLSEERFKAFFEVSPEGLVLTDAHGFIQDTNRLAELLTGYTHGETVGVSIFKIRVLEKLGTAVTTQILTKSVVGQAAGPFDLMLTKQDGSTVPAEIITVPLQLGGQNIVLWTIRDVTDRKRAVLAASESERRYRQIIENATELVYSFDQEKNLTFIGPGAARYGLDAQRLVGRPVKELFRPDDQEQAVAYLDEIMKTGREGKAEFSFRDRAGRDVWLEFVTSPFRGQDGVMTGGQGVAHDVTDWRGIREKLAAGEKRYRSIIETSRDAILEIDPKGTVTYFSPALQRNFGIDSAMTNQSIFNYVHPDDRQRIETGHFRSVMEGDETPSRFRIINDRGEVLWVEASSRVQRDESGQTTGIISVLRDISDRVRTEEGLRQSEAGFRNIISNTPQIAISLFDRQGRLVFWNRAAESLYGYATGEVAGKTVEQLGFEAKTASVFSRTLLGVMKTGQTAGPTERELRTRNGAMRNVLSTVFSVGEGGQQQAVCLDVDVTDLKQTQTALAESQSRYVSLVDSLTVGIYRRTPGLDGKLVECNDAFVRIFDGTDRRQAEGLPAAAIYRDAADNERFEKVMAEKGLIRNFEMPLKTLKGREIWVSVSSVRLKKDGQVFYDGIIEDITERRLAEARLSEARRRYEYLLDNLNAGVFRVTVAAPNRFTLANAALYRILDVPSFEQLSPTSVESYFVDGAEYRRLLGDVKQAGELRNAETRMRTSRGKELWAKLTLFGKTSESGEAVVDGLIEDITEKHQVEEHLRETDRLRHKFIQVVSHQLRMPLTSMRWSLESLLSGEVGELKPEQKNFVQVVLDADTAIIARIREMVAALDIEEGRFNLNKEETGLGDLCTSVMSEVVRAGQAKNVHVEYQPPTVEMPSLLIDAEKIREALRVILDNAITYTPAGGTVKAKLGIVGDRVRFEAADTGIGIPAVEQPRVFGRFYRATNALLARPDASGLGLSIAKHYIEQHGGRIGFTSEEGKGSVFWFDLPLKG
ncbi:MAG: PAS domain S-box protein [Patescibacteria group bacterium]|nr:PAS domain S-box protein [Patescibacteria group bacterium]